jgi:geranylgeranyl transferase type-2 subunit beta
MLNYIEALGVRLASGLAELPEAQRMKHTRYLLSRQEQDGGFAGREGGSDLYYTGFALRAIAGLGSLQGETAERGARFLRDRWAEDLPAADLASLVYGVVSLEVSAGIDVFPEVDAWRDRVAAAWDRLRRNDGGYAKSSLGFASSTYSTFLALTCLQLVDRFPLQTQQSAAFVLSQWCDGGGFREIRVAKRAGTNPTAAAVGTLRILNSLPSDIRQDTAVFLREMQTEEGGLRAHTRIPVADLLSTFTGLLTLVDVDALDAVAVDPVRGYVDLLERPEGGFHAASWDVAHDVEYAFYGLGCLALLPRPSRASA